MADQTREFRPNTTRNRHLPELEDAIRLAGLCASCVRVGTCTFRRDIGQMVIQCDEYTAGQALSLELPVAVQAPEPEDLSLLKGLCVNCAVRRECALPHPEEGVWHCSEYV